MSAILTIIRRIAATLPLIALVLPVVIVEDCTSHKTKTLAGWQLLAEGAWIVLVPALAYALWRVIHPALPTGTEMAERIAAVRTWALDAVLGAAGAFAPVIVALFDRRTYLYGFWVEVIGWTILWLTSAANAMRALHNLPTSAPRTPAGWIVTGWLYAAGIAVVAGPAAWSATEEAWDPMTVPVGLVLGLPLAVLGFCLARALDLASTRWTVAGMVLASLPALYGVGEEAESALLAWVGIGAGVVALGSLTAQLTVTTDH